jgi:hypothetical protein
MRTTLALLPLALLAASAGLGAQSFSTVEERMSAAEFRDAGLDTLTEAQLQSLNAWLQRNASCEGGGAALAGPGGPRAARMDEDDRADVVSRLPGTFTGWQGSAVFRLENGQVWRSIDPDSSLRGVNLTNPKVTIERGIFGVWRLKVEGYNTAVKVERIE